MKTSRITLFLLAVATGAASAQITWTGNGNPNNSGAWSDSANWGGSVPDIGDTAGLGNVTSGTRTVTYDAAASGKLGGIDITQSTAGAVNAFSIKRNLTLTNGFAIGATAGTSEVRFGGAAEKITLQVGANASSPGITVESGGRLVFDFIQGSSSGNDLASNVIVNTGGVFQVGSSATGTSASTAQNTLTRGLSLAGGSVLLDTTSYSAVRLAIQGAFSSTGGSISTTSGSGGSIFFDGPSVSLANTTIGSVNFSVRGSGTKTFQSDTALNRLYLIGRNNADLEVSVTAPTATGLYLTQESAGRAVALKLTGNLALASNGVQLSATGGATSGVTTYQVNTNGHVLDLSLGQNYGKWTPNKGSETTALWDLRGSNGTGGIKARAFDLSAANVQTVLGAGLVLEAISGSNVNSRASNLSGVGEIDAASVFRFNPADTSYAGTLRSNRNIGILEVKAGTLTIDGDVDFNAAGGIVVAAGAELNLGARAVGTSKYTFGVNGANIGKLNGGTTPVSLAGSTLIFNFESSAQAGTYEAFANPGGITGGLGAVQIAGLYSLNLANSGNEWNGSTGGYNFSFSSETGYFTVSAVPEPSTTALGVSGAALVATLLGRRRQP
ncbi:hypothetical protein DB345_10635 [Spartobacteria bacterium LR76]|nr:hypothetical protein DB345_10635 [Spartobacteria bacterium LR76]